MAADGAPWRRWLPRVLGIALLLGLALVAREPLGLARHELAEFRDAPEKVTPPEPTPAVASLTLTTAAGRTVAAWYCPSSNGAAVLLAHGSDDTRVELWPELKALQARGFGVLAFDWPGHGESQGPIRLGTPEREAFKAALDYLATRAGVSRVGVYGFSLGAALATMFAAGDQRVRALMVAGDFTDATAQTHYQYRDKGVIGRWAADQVDRLKTEGGNIRPIDFAPGLKGRRTLFVNGTLDDVVAPRSGQQLAEAAGGESWLVEGAGHGDFGKVLGAQWTARLVGFFEQTLLDPRAP